MAFRFDRLKDLRKEKGYKQVTLAKDLHIGRSTLAMWETGQSEPSTEMCSRLAELLGCSVGYLMGTEDEINAQHEKRPKNKMAQIANPLAGLVICAQCGRMMQYKGDRHRRNGLLNCVTQHCPTAGTYIDVVEGVVLDGLRAWVNAYEARDAEPAPAPSANASATDAARAQLTDQLTTLEGQSGRLFDLLEQGVYDTATFRERRADLESRIGEVKAALAALDAPPPPDPVLSVLPQVRTVLGAYDLAATPAEKNALLRTVLDHISYIKTQRCQRNNAPTDHLSLTLFPRVPEAYDEDFSAQNSGSMV